MTFMTEDNPAWSNLRVYAKGKVNLYTNDVTDTANSYCQIHPKLSALKVLIANVDGKQGLEYVVINANNEMMYHTRYSEELMEVVDLLADVKKDAT